VASRRPGSSAGNNTSSAALRGALLIGVAVILGAALLAQSFRDGGSPINAGSNTSTTVKRTGTSTTATSVPQPHDPAAVKVLVLNGSGKAGIAKAGADQLKSANYTTLDPSNAATSNPIATSVVYFTPGYERSVIRRTPMSSC
jgi:hypothetical protein